MAGCVRTAWLDLYGDGTDVLPLEDASRGYFCTELDLGLPTVREVISNRPDLDGADDRTRLMGSRVVSASISALAGAGAQVDAVAARFAPFMVPAARPVLHYILDRPGAAERTLTLRASAYAWPIAGPYQRYISLQWVAADPIARDPVQQSETAQSGTVTSPGRQYNLSFNRIYPPGTGSASSVTLSTPGDVGIRPLVRIYGPVTQPQLTFQRGPGGAITRFNFFATFSLSAGQWVDIDAQRHTVARQGDMTQPAISSVDWSVSTAPYIPPLPATVIMSITGTSTSSVTQAVALWHDGYIS